MTAYRRSRKGIPPGRDRTHDRSRNLELARARADELDRVLEALDPYPDTAEAELERVLRGRPRSYRVR